VRESETSRADAERLQTLCDEGQSLLERMEYLAAISVLEQADLLATRLGDFDTLSRLYMPLQEARRQSRQRAGEGTVRLDLLEPPGQPLDLVELATRYPHGQLLVAGHARLTPSLSLRALQRQRMQYAETFLATWYDVGAARAVLIVPHDVVAVPDASRVRSIDDLTRLAPPHSVILPESDLPTGERPGNTRTFAWTMGLWERLHLPYLAMAKAVSDPLRRIEACRRAIVVDPACEPAHQLLADTARALHRGNLQASTAG